MYRRQHGTILGYVRVSFQESGKKTFYENPLSCIEYQGSRNHCTAYKFQDTDERYYVGTPIFFTVFIGHLIFDC
jgi:hypothetical protein